MGSVASSARGANARELPFKLSAYQHVFLSGGGKVLVPDQLGFRRSTHQPPSQ